MQIIKPGDKYLKNVYLFTINQFCDPLV